MAGKCGLFENIIDFAQRYLAPIPRPKQPYTRPPTNPFSKLKYAADIDETTLSRTFVRYR